jgi:N-acyl-D-amino-acid deacylase
MQADTVIRNARIVDGAGTPWFRGDVAVTDGRIAAVGRMRPDTQAGKVIEAGDRYLMPGFVDPHTHSDWVLLENPGAGGKLVQGVTTQAIGQCGYSGGPVTDESCEPYSDYIGFLRAGVEPDWTWRSFGQWLDRLDSLPLGTNVTSFVGHATVWTSVMGFSYRRPDTSELAAMADLVRVSMEEGACGMTSGLVYYPGLHCPPREIGAVAAGLRNRRGLYESHMRNESWNLLACVAETIDVGRQNGIAVQISHHKACGRKNHGLLPEALRLVDAARAEGLDVTFNQYPYTAASTTLRAILPPWASEGGIERQCELLESRETRDRVTREILAENFDWENYYQNSNGAEGIILLYFPRTAQVEGMTLAQAAKCMGVADPLEAAYDLIVANRGEDTTAYVMMSEEDVACGLRHPAGMVGSDSIPAPEGAKAHPRLAGTYPRVLAHYVKHENLLRLEEAVRKMTSAPARRLGVMDRGLIAPGMAADLVLVDLDRIVDNATFANPQGRPEGLDLVMVNGVVAVEGGNVLSAGSGRVLR